MNSKLFYLYRIFDQINNKVYIGQTVNPSRRWNDHKWLSINKQEQYIHRAMAKYGVENFIFEVIATCKTSEDANESEKTLILQYDSRNNEMGYNLAPGGDTPWNLGLPKELNPLTGIPRSKEVRSKISEATMGKEMPPHTDEWKKHMSEIMTGRTLPKEQVDKIADANRGQKRTDEAKSKMSKSHLGNLSAAKINWNIVHQIRIEYSNGGISHRALAKKYNMSQGNISDILNYKIWKEEIMRP